MAIGTLAAIGIGLAGVGSVVSSSSQSSAANTASATAERTAQMNNALARDIYGQNREALSPYMQRGNVAGDYINAMLGLPSPQATIPQVAIPQQGFGTGLPQGRGPRTIFDGPYNPAEGFGMGGFGTGANPQGPTMTANPGVTTQDAQNAFGQYIRNSDYGFKFGQGSNAVNSGYAGAGTLKSGAAMKALEEFRQNLQSGYRNEFMNALGNQQGVGLSGASALAGVGQNYVNTISANNNSAGTAAANAALVRGNNSFGNTLSMIGGGLFGYRG